MSRVTFENYARLSKQGVSPTVEAGRYASQAEAERRIVPDVMAKLDLQPDDSVLEIGCGTGNLLIPISFLVDTVTGVDHPDILTRLETRFPDRIEPLPGNFLDIPLDRKFSKILIYSVLHCLTDEPEATAFLEKALRLVAPGGRLLLGDLPNANRKTRFLESDTGKAFEAEWRKQGGANFSHHDLGLARDSDVFQPDDRSIAALASLGHRLGFNAYLMPQNTNLPFGHTREDLLFQHVP